MRSVGEARALAGLGLEGDRYCTGIGTYSTARKPQREVTLIEIEALQALERDYGLVLTPEESLTRIESFHPLDLQAPVRRVGRRSSAHPSRGPPGSTRMSRGRVCISASQAL